MSNLEFARAQARDTKIKLHGADAFAGMAKAGRLVAEVLDLLVDEVKPGVTTEALDAVRVRLRHGAWRHPRPAQLSRLPEIDLHLAQPRGLPRHPGPARAERGRHPQYRRDAASSTAGTAIRAACTRVGKISRAAERLLEVTYNALMRGVAAVKPGATTGDIGAAIQTYAESERCSVVRDFCGHGLGRVFHDRPNILHYGEPGEGLPLKPGMLFTIEPMINLGKPHVKILSDGWTAVTRDRSLSAQFEHTVGVTETGCEVFTVSPRGLGPAAAHGRQSSEG